MASFLNCSTPDRAIARLESILDSDTVPTVFRGLWSTELGKQLAKTSRIEDMAKILDKADQDFQACGHRWGPLETRFLRLQHGLVNSPNVLADLVDLARVHLDANYPYGVLQTMLEALTLAFKKGDFSTYLNLQEVLHNVCTSTGLVKEKILREIQLVAALNSSESDRGKVLELGQRLYDDCLRHEYWTPAFLAGRVLSLGHLQVGNLEEAESLAVQIHNLSARQGLPFQSQANYHLAMIRSSAAMAEAQPTRLKKLQAVIDLLLATIPDKDHPPTDPEDISTAADGLCLIASMQFDIARGSSSDAQLWAEKAEESIARARLLAKSLPEDKKDEYFRITSNCDDFLVTRLLHEATGRQGDGDKVLQAIDICSQLIAQHHSRGSKFAEAMDLQRRALCQFQRYRNESDTSKKISHLGSAEEDFVKAEAIFSTIGSRQQAMGARHWLCRLYLIARGLSRGSGFEDATLNMLKSLESASDLLRRELSVLGGLQAVRQKQRFVANTQVCDLYEWAIGVNLDKRDAAAVWTWSQKRKARSISDMLGIGIMVPAAIREKISRDTTANELYRKLVSLQSALSTAPDDEKVYIRKHIEKAEDEIRNHDAFSEFVRLRDGTVRGIADLEALVVSQETSTSPGKRIIFVDWIFHFDNIFVLTADCSRPAETCTMVLLPFGRSYIDAWLSQHWATTVKRRDCLKGDSLKDLSKPLRQLDRLIAPAVKVSMEGDLLIFSPTGPLSSLPLHALRVETDGVGFRSQHLLERNPVVYAPSGSILQICLTRSREVAEASPRPSVFFGVLDDMGTERDRVYRQMNQLAAGSDGGGVAYCGNQATKRSFAEATRGAGLVHYHGHCRFSVQDPLKQCLVLAPDTTVGDEKGIRDSTETSLPKGTEPSTSEAPMKPMLYPHGANQIHGQQDIAIMSAISISAPGSGQEVIASLQAEDDITNNCLLVPDVFNLSLTAPLVVLVGCESASHTVSTGDEYLGLTSALLCAGAASVIGASWPIPTGAGRNFSEVFYKEIRNSAAGEDGLVDVAAALQEAALTVMDEPTTSAPYYWAGFCLYGSWVFRR
ncbi:CHAT domain-containing protein [Echria macrotheca]|uniref:CHAT domain-containing protein n=1 Tax=Echria macrotheca TaxID=438768 RepID=A0AAJ0FET2_9PEZI|nr:CHAT domain-containing protein [Echria macrotheca]